MNPFVEDSAGEASDRELVEAAQRGDRHALEDLVRRHQAWVYNIALRMVWDPTEAEDVTQEVLVKVVTRLSTYEGRSGFRTWLYRIACNHVLNRGRGRFDNGAMTFDRFGAELDAAAPADLPDPRSVRVELPVLVEEAKLGWLQGMLLCLDRRQRLVFVLGELFGVTAEVGAEVVEVTPVNFRQLLARARRELYGFMQNTCGLVNRDNPCRCARKTRAFIDAGYVDPERVRFAEPRAARVRRMAPESVETLERGIDRWHRDEQRTARFLSPPDIAGRLRVLLDDDDLRRALDLG